MALIKCPECGKEISDKAVSCLHCGYPLASILQEENKTVLPQEKSSILEEPANMVKPKESNCIIKERKNSKKRIIAIMSIVMAVIIVACVGIAAYKNLTKITIEKLVALDTKNDVSFLLGKEPTARFDSYLVDFLGEDFYVDVIYDVREDHKGEVNSIFMQNYYPGADDLETYEDLLGYTISENDRRAGRECLKKVVDSFSSKYGNPEVLDLKRNVVCYGWTVGDRRVCVYDYTNSYDSDASWGAVKISISKD